MVLSNTITIALLLPITGAVVTAVMVAVSRSKKRSGGRCASASQTLFDWAPSRVDGKEKSAKATGKAKKKSGKQQQKAAAQKNEPRYSHVTAPSQDALLGSEIGASSGAESSSHEEEELELLASLQKPSKTFAAKSKSPAPFKPSSSQPAPSHIIPAQAEDLPAGDDEEGWSKVPTKEEQLFSSLKGRAENLSKKVEDLEALRAGQERSLEMAQERSKILEAELKERTQGFQLRILAAENDISALKSTNQALIARIQETEGLSGEETARAKEEARRLAEDIRHLEDRAQQIAEETNCKLAEKTAHAAAQSAEIGKLKETIEALAVFKNKHISLESDFANLKKVLFDTESDLINARSLEAARSAEHKRSLEAKDAIVEEARSRFQEQQAQAENLTSELSMARSEIEALKATRVQLKATEETAKEQAEHRARLESELAQEQTAVEGFKVQLESLQAELAQLKESKASLEKKGIEDANKIAELATSLNVASQKLAAEEQSKAMEMHKLSTEISYLKVQIDQFTATHLGLEQEITKFKAELAEAQTNSTAPSVATAVVDVLQSELDKTKADLQAVKKKFADHLVQNAGIKTAKEALEAENKELLARLGQFQSMSSMAGSNPTIAGR